jgi:hypothetical protein
MSRLLKIIMIVGAIIAALTAALMMHGCATVGPIAKACAPATGDQMQAVLTLWERPDLTTVETVAILEGGKIALCVVSEIARGVLASTANVQASAALGGPPPLMLLRAEAWLTAHP